MNTTAKVAAIPEEAPAIKSVEGWVVVVTNLNEEISEEDVTDAFSEYGTVRNIHLNLDRRTGYVKGYALIEYKEAKEAEMAVREANGMELYDKKIEVDFAFVAPPERDNAFAPASSTNQMQSSRDRSRSPGR